MTKEKDTVTDTYQALLDQIKINKEKKEKQDAERSKSNDTVKSNYRLPKKGK
jgi:hypothetical protein